MSMSRYLIPPVYRRIYPYSYQWDFGDKVTSTDNNPTHSYGSTGKYTVNLKITDGRGNVVTDKVELTISGAGMGERRPCAWRALATWQGVTEYHYLLGIFSPVWIIGAAGNLLLPAGKKKSNVPPPNITGSPPGPPAL